MRDAIFGDIPALDMNKKIETYLRRYDRDKKCLLKLARKGSKEAQEILHQKFNCRILKREDFFNFEAKES